MATAHVNRQTDDITNCPICGQLYTEPRVLSCIHTFCLKCIQGFSKGKQPGDEVPCPTCHNKFTVPDNGLCNLPQDHFVEHLVQLEQLSITQNGSTRCDLCVETTSATVYCPQCWERLCKTCATVHQQQKVTQTHKLMPVGEQLSTEEIRKYPNLKSTACEKHSKNNLEFYCRSCRLLLCTRCCLVNHKSHEYSDVEDISEEFNVQFSSNVSSMAAGVKECQETARKLETEKNGFMKKISQAEREVCKKVLEQKEMLERHKQELLEELNSLKQRSTKEIESFSEKVNKQIKAMERVGQYASELQSKGAACDVARMANDLNDRADELLKCKDELLEYKVTEQSRADLDIFDVKFMPSNLMPDDHNKTVGEIVFQSRPAVDDRSHASVDKKL